MPGDNQNNKIDNTNRRNISNLTEAEKLHRKGDSNNSSFNKKNSAINNNNNDNNSVISRNPLSGVVGNILNKTPINNLKGKNSSLNIDGNNIAKNKLNNNIGKRNLNDNVNIAQPSKTELDKDKEKNSSKLKEQIQKNAIRKISNAALPGIGGKVVDEADKSKKNLKSKEKKRTSKSENNDTDGNKDASSELRGNININKAIKHLLPIILGSILTLFILIIPVLAVSRFKDLVGVGSAGIAADPESAAGTDKELLSLYNKIIDISHEYKNNGKNVSADKIVAVYHILSSENSNFSISDMDDNLIREIADNMFRESCDSNNKCSYSYSEDAFKNYLVNTLFPRYMHVSKCSEAADEVLDYIAQYLGVVNPEGYGVSSCVINGNTQGSILKGASHDEYFNIMGPIANQVYASTGIFASVTLAQSIIEGGWGKSSLASDYNNMFGIKCSTTIFADSTWDGTCTPPLSTSEQSSGGSYYNIMAQFKKYRSIEEAVLDHNILLSQGRTYTAHNVALATTPYEQIVRLKEAGYATEQSYVNLLNNVIKQYNLEVWDTLNTNSCVIDGGDYKTWLQSDPRWATVKIGKSDETVGSVGCLSTAIAMLVKKFNVDYNVNGEFNPGSFVTALSSVGGYSGANLLWSKVSEIVPSFKFGGNVSLSNRTKQEKLSIIKQYYDNGYAIVLEVKGNTGQHWVAVDSVSQNGVTMMDSGSNQTDLWGEYNWKNTSRLVYYKVG